MTDYRATFLARVMPTVIPLPQFLFDEQRKTCNRCLHVRHGYKPAMRCAKFQHGDKNGNGQGMHYCLDARTMANLCGPLALKFVEAAA